MKVVLFLTVLFALLALTTARTCNVLAASGGGDRIAFEIGLLKVLAQSGAKYDVVTGISAGSLVAGVMSRWPVGKEQEAVDELTEVVMKLTGRPDILADWPGGIVEGLLSHTGLFDSTPLKKLINQHLGGRPATDREMRIGAVSLGTSQMDIYRQNSTNLEDGILASCSVPGIFPAVNINMPMVGPRFSVDGGTKQNIIITQGIEACLAKGFKESEIVVDSLLCYNGDFEDVDDLSGYKTLDVALRALASMRFHSSVKTFTTVVEKYPYVNMRYIFEPQMVFESVGLNFDPIQIRIMYEHGVEVAQEMLAKNPSGNGMQKIKELIKRTQDVHAP